MRVSSLVLLLLLATITSASATPVDLVANLDSDPETEQVTTIAAPGTPGRRISIKDACDGRDRVVPISEQDPDSFQLEKTTRVVDADGRPDRPEVYFMLVTGVHANNQESRVVRYDSGDANTCPRPRDLFRLPSRRWRGPIPAGAEERIDFHVSIRNYSPAFAGKELRVVERYDDVDIPTPGPPTSGPPKADFKRISYFRYSAGMDAYVRYTTKVGRLA